MPYTRFDNNSKTLCYGRDGLMSIEPRNTIVLHFLHYFLCYMANPLCQDSCRVLC
jgi:hypothetical protein